MSNKNKKIYTYGAGGIGTPSTGPKGGEPQGLLGSSSYDCGAQKVVHQAAVQKSTTGEKSSETKTAHDVETWYSTRSEEETFGRAREGLSTQPPEVLDKTLMGGTEEMAMETIDESVIEVVTEITAPKKEMESKIDRYILTMNKLVLTLIEAHAAVFKMDKHELKPSTQNAMQKMETCVDKMAKVIDQLNAARSEEKKQKLSMTVLRPEKDKKQMISVAAQTECDNGNEGIPGPKNEAYGKVANRDIRTTYGKEKEFPTLTSITGQKRKEISPTLKEGKKTKRGDKSGQTGPRIKSVETIITRTPDQEGNHDQANYEWEIVKRRKIKQTSGTPRPMPETPIFGTPGETNSNKKGPTKRKRMKPQAIAIRFEASMSFSEVLKKVKKTVGPSPEGIKGVRQTRAGNLLLEFTPKADVEAFKKVIDGKLGTEVTISRLQERMDVEIKGIDPDVEGEEILAAVFTELSCPKSDVRLKILRTDPRRNKIAIIEGPAASLNNLVEKGKIRVGWTIATVKEIPRILRCFRCHALGHVAAACKRFPETETVLCRRCGAQGHSLRECKDEHCCRLCVEKGAAIGEANHVAASIRCPIYREAVRAKKINT
uniref:uncharacterized protein LOC117611121 n=1 Tax=Osmia lignaria TaxID=473952 RepID=UPI0014789F3A|nr:uncharacterized protein LOC117611121 [Osmia lignaria]